MLIGGFVLIRALCFELLNRTGEYSKEFQVTEEMHVYFKMMGLIIYVAFMDTFELSLSPVVGNTEAISAGVSKPSYRKAPMYFCKMAKQRSNHQHQNRKSRNHQSHPAGIFLSENLPRRRCNFCIKII